MKIISWNVQGICGADTQRAMKEMKNHHRPDIFAIMEPRVGGDHALKIIKKLGFARKWKGILAAFGWNPNQCQVTIPENWFIA